MAPDHDPDWSSDSDIDEEPQSSETTPVLLGVPDGPIDDSNDLRDPLVSKIGGSPAFVRGLAPPLESATCKNCLKPMELAIQMWCPRENSPMDRALYIWACSRAGCQRKDGSIRAFRGLSFNSKYAAELKRKDKKKRKIASPDESSAPATKSNPFSLSSQQSGATFGTDFFVSQFEKTGETTDEKNKEEDESEDEVSDLANDLHGVSLDLSIWESQPIHSPLYLATIDEVIPLLKPAKSEAKDVVEDSGTGGQGTGIEMYENSLDTDAVFERFTRRVLTENEQCVRYELNGTPLAFQTDEVYKKIFPLPKPITRTVTGAAFAVTNAPRRQYDISSLAACSFCGKKRIFECQLMPHLINLLRTSTSPSLSGGRQPTAEERQKEVERLVKGLAGGVSPDEVTGMEWGTCMVFCCEDDCCVEKNEKNERWEARSCWREEVVLVQWEL